LQTAAPMATDFVVTQAMPLPDELLTVVQVLLLTREEFEDLKQAHSEEEKEEAAEAEAEAAKQGSDAASKGAKPTEATGGREKGGVAESGGPSSATNADQQQQRQQCGHRAEGRKPLLLGTSLMGQDPDFAELVSLTLIQVLDAALQKYPTSLQEDLQLLQAQPHPAYDQTEAEAKHARRKHLALKVRVAEKTVLQAAKREAVMLVINLQSKRGGSMEGSESLEGESSEEDADSDDGDDDDDEEEMGSEEEAELLQQLLRAKQKQEQKQQAGAANTKRGTAEQQQPSGSSGHGGKRKQGGEGAQEEVTKRAKRGK